MTRPGLPAAALALLLAAAPAAADDVLVVTPKELAPALADWTEHRERGGWTVLVRAPGEDVTATVAAVHKERPDTLKAVLLLGDVAQVPCAYRPADAISRWERDPRIATDAPYADVNADGMPDLALGRLPARTLDEARRLLARSVAYERSADFGTWRRKLRLVGGVGGFGAQQDAAIEQLTTMVMNRAVPESAEVSFAYAKETSAWCPPPARFSDTFLDGLNAGSLVVAYVGHGSRTHLDRVTSSKGTFPILEAQQVERVAITGGAPLLVFVACSTGAFDGEPESLAEEVLRRPDGPVAVIASSRVSTPYSNAILSLELLTPLYGDGAVTAGDLLLRGKRALLATDSTHPLRVYMETLAANVYEPDQDRRAKDRTEHVLLYHLFGDPCTVLARPAALAVEADEEVTAGSKLRVRTTTSFAGTLLLELVRRRDQRPRVPTGARTDEEMAATYAKTQDRVVASASSTVAAGALDLELPVPEDLDDGRYMVRVYVQGASASAMGGATVRVFEK